MKTIQLACKTTMKQKIAQETKTGLGQIACKTNMKQKIAQETKTGLGAKLQACFFLQLQACFFYSYM